MQHYKMENSTKSISTINPAITKNMEHSIVNAHTSFINLKVGVLLDYYGLFTSENLMQHSKQRIT